MPDFSHGPERSGAHPWGKPSGRGVNNPPQSSVEVKEGVIAITVVPFCDFVACHKAKFTFTFTVCKLKVGGVVTSPYSVCVGQSNFKF